MTTSEFSNEFDILYNNISSNQAPGLTEYEKSVFLTNAQDALVLELITGKNPLGDSFEKTEELREYLTSVIRTEELQPSNESFKIVSNSKLYESPEDLWFIIYESVSLKDDKLICKPSEVIEVIPVTHDEFSRIYKNPFRRPKENKILRLNVSNTIELVSKYNIEKYTIRYIPVLDPIILSDISSEGLTIKGKNKKTECTLNPALHEAILGRAVQLAKTSMGLLGPGN